ncbi:hypothetical protein TIFTF001_048068 [Ficus carica]|uniref:Uncharacterized protein n=1 Tax=Ficus carica TaxID=3494 RepID=A0AA87ZQF4_FICCA|nr:hypothetical protein TIFTF001_048062 [Ficus carica]GMN31108.1 hypothetical protein TIFTF001_048066 [Ficus carica]GMN31128.1 hypothetical protein TIFTF001_048067 [Ficus carica]GMN31141.1 hypothetical protein TIFTF001_048068 [Ficus carica]
MACNGVRQPLLLGRTDLNPQMSRKRIRRCKSAPLAEYVPFQKSGIGSAPAQTNALFGNIHPNIFKVFMFLAFYLSAATICFYIVRNHLTGKKTNGVLDAVYFCIVTMTTVGYGDLVPSSKAAKLLACAFVFAGMALVCLILSKAADYLVEKQEILLVRALHMRKKVSDIKILKEAEINRTKYKCIVVFVILVLLVIAGTVFLFTVEKLDLVDAFYCVCSTITTLGYGDKSFSTEGGRVFAVFWILLSTLCLAQFFLYIAELRTENRQRELVKWVLTRKVTNVDLEAADLDDNGTVDAAEFVLYKLQEMGKISQDDISLFIDEFDQLDVDQSGTLSPSDFLLAQSSEIVQK